MSTSKHAVPIAAGLLAAALLLLPGSTALGQDATQECKPSPVIPLTAKEPPAKLVIGRPLPEPLASRGTVVIPYCAHNMRLAPVFGPGALEVSPRLGHVHVTVDDAPFHWADASGNPIIIGGLAAGSHKVLIELVNANHGVVDKGTISFQVPKRAAASASH
jgi:hypothetical protein